MLKTTKMQIAAFVACAAFFPFLTGCPPTGDESEEQGQVQTCSNLTFKENIAVTDEDGIYEALFDCYEDLDAGVKTFGGIAYDVGFSDNGEVDCVALYREEIVPRSDLDAMQECQVAILKEARADPCEDCGLRGFGFLLCYNEFNSNDCDAFIAETRQ